MNLKALVWLIFCTVIVVNGLKASAGAEFNMLKSMLSSRQREPKIYLPQSVNIGSDLEVLVLAPGAKSIKLYSSKESGDAVLGSQKLRLGGDFTELGQQAGSRAEFKIKLDADKYTEMLDKFLYFDAIASYPDGTERSVEFYGSNAAFSNINAVKVTAIPKDNASAAGMARAMLPGFFNNPNQQNRF